MTCSKICILFNHCSLFDKLSPGAPFKGGAVTRLCESRVRQKETLEVLFELLSKAACEMLAVSFGGTEHNYLIQILLFKKCGLFLFFDCWIILGIKSIMQCR